MAKKITLKNKNGVVLCPHTAIEQVQGLKEALDKKLGKTEKAASATQDGSGNVITSTYATKDEAFRYLGYNLDLNNFYDNENKNGTIYINTPDSAGNITNAPDYYGGAVNFGAGVSNFQLFSPAYSNKLYHRNRWWSDRGGEWKEWKQLRTIDDKVTTSHIADAAITSEKLAQSLILRGTPQLETQPTLSSESQNIASVGLVKNLKIDTRNLLTNSKEITIDGSALTSGSKYITKKLPISVAVGDVLTFNCEDLIINAGTGQTHAIVLRVPGVGALAPMQWISPTSKTATITVTQASDTPHLYIYAGYADDSAGKSITYKGATLVKGTKPMLLWQPSVEEVQAQIEAARPTVYRQSTQPSVLTAREGDIWIVS